MRELKHLLLPESRVSWPGSLRVELAAESGSKVACTHDTETEFFSPLAKIFDFFLFSSVRLFPPIPPTPVAADIASGTSDRCFARRNAGQKFSARRSTAGGTKLRSEHLRNFFARFEKKISKNLFPAIFPLISCAVSE